MLDCFLDHVSNESGVLSQRTGVWERPREREIGRERDGDV